VERGGGTSLDRLKKGVIHSNSGVGEWGGGGGGLYMLTDRYDETLRAQK